MLQYNKPIFQFFSLFENFHTIIPKTFFQIARGFSSFSVHNPRYRHISMCVWQARTQNVTYVPVILSEANDVFFNAEATQRYAVT